MHPNRSKLAAGDPESSGPATLEAARVKEWSSTRSLLLLTAATLICLLPFSGKAFHIDDPLFLWSAQQITKHPLDPFGFNLVWYRTLMPMSEITKNPPLACYYAAAIGSIAGWSERALHLGFLLPALAMVLGTYRLAQRFTRSPLIAALATLLTPGVLVSASSVMCDTMMLAFWIWAIIFWLDGLDSHKGHLLLVSSLLMAAAALTKYFGISLLPLLFVYSLVRQRRLGSWAWYFVVPISLLVGYELWMQSLYGSGMFFEAATYAPQRFVREWYRILFIFPLVCASFIGGCALSALTLAPLVWSRKHILLALVVEAVAIGLGVILLGSHFRTTRIGLVLQQHWAVVGAQLVIFIVCGVSVLALAAVDLWKHRDADSLLLALWVFGTYIFTAFLNWTINARSILPLIPATGILLARRLDIRGVPLAKALQWKVAAALLVSGVVSLWIAQADAEWANSQKQTAMVLSQRAKNEAGTTWFQGHWGFQYYVQQLGLRPLDFTTCTLNPGDVLAVPRTEYTVHELPKQFVASRELLQVRLRQPIALMFPDREAGFYAASFGSLPFAFGFVPTDQYEVFHIGSTLRPEQWPHPEPEQ